MRPSTRCVSALENINGRNVKVKHFCYFEQQSRQKLFLLPSPFIIFWPRVIVKVAFVASPFRFNRFAAIKINLYQIECINMVGGNSDPTSRRVICTVYKISFPL